MGFFAWLREGVRRSVLLGFSDAIAQIGNRAQSDDLGPQLVAALQQGMQTESAALVNQPASSTGRRRLGKSLEEIRTAAQA
jgi:hypothetical protein